MELLNILAVIKIVACIWTLILIFAVYKYLKGIFMKIPSISINKTKKQCNINYGGKSINIKINKGDSE